MNTDDTSKLKAAVRTGKFTLGQLFTEAQLRKAEAIVRNAAPGECNKRLVDEVITEALPRINEITGQENDALYFGYVLEAALAHLAPRNR